MGKITGFMEYTREAPKGRPVEERIQDFQEVYAPTPEETLKAQGARRTEELKRALADRYEAERSLVSA